MIGVWQRYRVFASDWFERNGLKSLLFVFWRDEVCVGSVVVQVSKQADASLRGVVCDAMSELQ